MVAVLFLGSLQLIGIGILGEYIGRIYMESPRTSYAGSMSRSEALRRRPQSSQQPGRLEQSTLPDLTHPGCI